TSATQYRFRLELFDEMSPTPEVPVYSQYVDRPVKYVSLNQFTGLQPGVTYVITVAVEMFGEFGPYGKDCAVTTPAFAAKSTPAMVTGFEATVYPNPFTTNFTLAVETSSQSSIDVKVYDMVGRLVDQRTVSVSELKKGILGDQYPSGVYNVIITQDEVVKTLRVVKR
ncbi:T9SS type A sorting domain-containing protein, partial [Flavobacterium sp. J49]|uniref:T9SS type A sorting domain-containing protein n=1 Tax=Flavobacterium sp. J49 TaxID=2718534 RepID=UPI00159399C9